MLILEIIYNLLGLVALSVLSGFADTRYDRRSTQGKVLQGGIFGTIALISMVFPYQLASGIIFDGRSVVISLCTLFFGPVSGLISAVFALIYRISIGGTGLHMGISVILLSYFTGWFFHEKKKSGKIRLNSLSLYAFGLVVHLGMWLTLFLLPKQFRGENYDILSLTILGIYPFFNLIIGKILIDQELNLLSLEQVKRDESLIRATFYSIGDALITTDQEGFIQRMNPLAEELTGWKELNAKGRSIEVVFQLVDETNNPVSLEKACPGTQGESASLRNSDFSLLSRDQKQIPISFSFTSIRTNTENITGQVLVFRDQSEERAKVKSLEESSKMFQMTFNQSPYAMLLIDLDTGLIQDINRQFVELTGYKHEDLIGKYIQEIDVLIDPESYTVISETFRTHRSLNEAPLVINRKGNTLRHCLLSSNVINLNNHNLVLSSILDITEKKVADQALMASEKRFREIFDKHSAVKLLIDQESGAILDVNEAAIKYYGWIRKEFLKKNINDISISQTSANEFEKICKHKKIKVESQHRKADGSTSYVDIFSSAITVNGKELVHFIVHDITEQKRSEKQRQIQFAIANAMVKASDLRELFFTVKNELSSLIDTSNFIVALYDPFTDTLSAPFETDENNDVPPTWSASDSLTGYLIRNRKSLLLNRDQTDQLARAQGLKIGGTRSECWLGVPMYIGDRTLGAILVQSYTDVKAYDQSSIELLELVANQISYYIERKHAEEESLKLSKAFIQSPITIVITDLKGKIEYVNPKFTETTGYSFSEAIGQNPRILKSGKQDTLFYKQLWETLLSGNEWSGEFLNRKKNGEEYWEKAIISPIIGIDGKFTHFMALKEDITEKKRLHDELIIAKERAEESDRLKTAFLQNISHEIRTPLNGMMGFAYLLDNSDNEVALVRQYASIIRSSGKRLLELLNNVIDLSKIESGTLEICIKEFPLHQLINEALDQFRALADSKFIQLISPIQYTTQDLVIKTDELKLLQILSNLLDNAIKFTQAGSVEVGYALGKDEIVFSVRDTGIGIPILKQSKIFERFYQADMSISRGFEGSGLGLAICKGLVETLNGRIWIESVEDKGTNVYFSLPYEIGIISDKPSPAEGLEEEDCLYFNILIAEDDDFSFTFLETVLEHTSVTITRALTGIEAVNECQRNPLIDLVLMDIKMPEMNGIEASRRIKEIRPDLTIIAQTAYAFESEMKAAINAGCSEYLTKPVSLEKLKEAMKKHAKPPVEADR